MKTNRESDAVAQHRDRRLRRPPRFRLGFAAAVALVVLVPILLVACGSASDLLRIAQQLRALGDFGGALVRLYGADNSEEFVDVVDYQGQFFVLGWSDSIGPAYRKPVILRLSYSGDILETLTLSTSDNYHIEPTAMAWRYDNFGDKLIIAADLHDGGSYDILVIQVNISTFSLDWANRLVLGGSEEHATDIFEEGEMINVVGHTTEAGFEQPCLVRVNGDGSLHSKWYLERSISQLSRFFAAIQVNDAFVCVGELIDGAGNWHGLVAEIATDSALRSVRLVDTDADDFTEDHLTAVTRTDDGSVIMGGYVVDAPWTAHQHAWWLRSVDVGLNEHSSIALWFDDPEPWGGISGLTRAGSGDAGNAFVATADSYNAVMMDTAGVVHWAARWSPGDIHGTSKAIVPINDGGSGYFQVGDNPDRPEADNNPSDTEPEGVAMWLMKSDGSSYPSTEPHPVTAVSAPAITQLVTGEFSLIAMGGAWTSYANLSGNYDAFFMVTRLTE